MDVSPGGVQVLAVMAYLFGIITPIFWMVVGWRAMRAHERIADASERAARRLPDTGP